MLEVHLSHLKNITTIGKKNITSITIFCHILIFTFFKCL